MSKECTCEPCSMCRGTGTIILDIGGRVIAHRMDDLDTLEMCEDCGGSGIAAECAACTFQREMDEDANDARE